MSNEKRAHQRFVFPKGSEVKAILIPVGGEGSFEVTILNVSRGGVGLATEKKVEKQLTKEFELLFHSITAGTGLPCLKGQIVRVKWILDYEPLMNLGIGCEFVDLNDECADELSALLPGEN